MAQTTLPEPLSKAIDKSIYFNQRIEGIFTGLTDILNNGEFDDTKKVELIRAKAQDLQYALMENNSAIDTLLPYLKPVDVNDKTVEVKEPGK